MAHRSGLVFRHVGVSLALPTRFEPLPPFLLFIFYFSIFCIANNFSFKSMCPFPVKSSK